ncbi:MAG TPA: hypothetical protein VGS13_01780, partial [Stellaceae bacterium]|nr:hypothetical protein [Stellaceae bacterium]
MTGIASATTVSIRDDVTPISLNASGATTGTFAISGTLDVDNSNFDGGSNLTLGGTLSNSGAVAIGNSNLSAATTVTATGLNNTGTINLEGNTASGTTKQAMLDIQGAVASAGTVTTTAGTLLSVTGGNAYTQAAGTTAIFCTLTAAAIDVAGGVLQGAGTMVGAVGNTGGTVEAENNGSAATLTISGSYAGSSNGVLEELLRGTGAGQAGLLAVSGPLVLGGGTLVATVSGFSLAAGQAFTVVTFQPGTVPGFFGSLAEGAFVGNSTYVNVGGGLTLGALYNITTGAIGLEVFNTPGTTADAWLGGSGVWSNAAGWSGGVPLPDSDVMIGETGSGSVTLDTSATIDSLTVAGGNALSFAAGESLAVGGALTVAAGATLTLSAGGDAIEVGGVVTDAGSMTITS